MNYEQIIESWKNPKLRTNLGSSHPSGRGFHELELEEMTFIAGGNGTADPQITPSILTTLVPYTPAISFGGGISAVSGLVSYTKDCI